MQTAWKHAQHLGHFKNHHLIPFLANKYRVLKSCDGDHLNQRVPGGTDITEGMARISGMNQMGLQKLKFQVS